MIAIRGGGSQIVAALRPMLPADEFVIRPPRCAEMPVCADRYLFCAGVLRPKKFSEQSFDEIEEGMRVNFRQVRDDCERILEANPHARICVIGSESAFRGSYDDVYALAKQQLHEYVQQRPIGQDQQLVCISPGVIGDAGMNTRRDDGWRTAERMEAHPKRRFLSSQEVARLVHFVLYQDQGYLTGVVIRLNGGEHTV